MGRRDLASEKRFSDIAVNRRTSGVGYPRHNFQSGCRSLTGEGIYWKIAPPPRDSISAIALKKNMKNRTTKQENVKKSEEKQK
jgi:hypothetical protein